MNGTKRIKFACIIALDTHSTPIYISKITLLHRNCKGKTLTKKKNSMQALSTSGWRYLIWYYKRKKNQQIPSNNMILKHRKLCMMFRC